MAMYDLSGLYFMFEGPKLIFFQGRLSEINYLVAFNWLNIFSSKIFFLSVLSFYVEFFLQHIYSSFEQVQAYCLLEVSFHYVLQLRHFLKFWKY